MVPRRLSQVGPTLICASLSVDLSLQKMSVAATRLLKFEGGEQD
ncbi:MAG: hypothetical protein SH868_13090 [Bythopirellula sp.]|nr:hypothetical protein [Bythopirellula sp.]